MKPSARNPLLLTLRQLAAAPPPPRTVGTAHAVLAAPLRHREAHDADRTPSRRMIHSKVANQAKVAPYYGIAPPPPPPDPSPEHIASRIARRKRQAEMLRQATQARMVADAENKGVKKRFWKDVSVKEIDGHYQVLLDTRPLRHPTTKEIIRLPLTKPHLAHALAIEWDQLTSAQEAARQHLVPLTSLVCRAVDIAEDDDRAHASSPHAASSGPLRTGLATMVLRYLDTDSLLCWAPAGDPDDLTRPESAINDDGYTLRELQERAALPIVGFLSTHVWPGVELRPVLDSGSIIPQRQPDGVREIVQGWVLGLDAWELAGLERAVLAGKGLLGAARLVAEWSEGPAGVRAAAAARTSEDVAAAAAAASSFGVEEAARAASIEVDWQTGRWGAVEDTHDVEYEDLRRQLGSVVLLVSGTTPEKSDS